MDQLKPSPPNSRPLTPISFIERASTVYGDCTSIVYGSTTYTWSQTYLRCLKIASTLSSLGITRGDVVSVVAPNIPAMYELHFAIPMAGAVLNSINLRLNAQTISVVLRHAESKLVFVDYQSESTVLEAISLFPPTCPLPRLVLIAEEGQARGSKPGFVADYDTVLANGDPNFDWDRPPPLVAEEEVGFLRTILWILSGEGMRRERERQREEGGGEENEKRREGEREYLQNDIYALFLIKN